jgi:hypothetical protein
MKDNIIVVFSSHYSETENQDFISHIKNTIGCKNKVVCYPNFNEYGLSEVYNRAILEHNTDKSIIVFCHNDIIVKTKNWGKILLNKFNNSNYSIIGVAGSSFLPESGMWWEDRTKMYGIVEHTNGISEWVSEFSKENKLVINPTVLIDGVFMAADCNNLEHNFDESFKGFHFYDLGFSVPNYLDGCDVGVTTAIRILHKSVGEVNEKWNVNRKQFIEQYKEELPLSIIPPHDLITNVVLTKEPKVTVIIPTKDNYELLSKNIKSWNDVVEYDNYEIIIADTGSPQSVIDKYKTMISDNIYVADKIRVVEYNYYNFGKINNDVVKNHVSDDTELILFCNDDVKLLNDAITKCVQVYNNGTGNIGTIGIRLHYADGSIQHNGILLIRDQNKRITLSHVDLKKNDNYSTNINYSSMGNTGGFMMINKERFILLPCISIRLLYPYRRNYMCEVTEKTGFFVFLVWVFWSGSILREFKNVGFFLFL